MVGTVATISPNLSLYKQINQTKLFKIGVVDEPPSRSRSLIQAAAAILASINKLLLTCHNRIIKKKKMYSEIQRLQDPQVHFFFVKFGLKKCFLKKKMFFEFVCIPKSKGYKIKKECFLNFTRILFEFY